MQFDKHKQGAYNNYNNIINPIIIIIIIIITYNKLHMA